MKCRLVLHSLLPLVLFLALAPTALASSTWYVDGVNGSDNNNCKSPQSACKTIGHAIVLASSGDSIMVAAATYKENLTVRRNLKIVGSGAKTTIIDGGGLSRVVRIPDTIAHVALSNVTIRNGSAHFGGGIYNAGILKLNGSTISSNKATASGGAGIWNDGRLTINESAITDNSGGYRGGGINNFGRLTINNSTISGNTAEFGGGIASNVSSLAINNSTISRNMANGPFNSGAGILNVTGTTTLQNSIVADNPHGEDCAGTMTSNGYNLSSDSTCHFNNHGDLNNTDPKLGPLQNNGGPTQTQALLSGSPAIDAGNPSGCTDDKGHLLKADQRGKPRPDHEDTGGCDMGAYESQKD